MLMYLYFMSLTMSNILEIDVAVVISSVFRIIFAKIHTDSQVVISMTLLFGRMLSFVRRFNYVS